MMMFLLISTVALLVSPAVPSPTHHKPEDYLNRMMDLVKQFNQTLSQELFVEDLLHLVEGGCEDKFFCKAHEILHKHEQLVKMRDLERNLKKFTDGFNTTCTELLKKVTSTDVKKLFPTIVEYLTTCIQQRNLGGNKTSSA